MPELRYCVFCGSSPGTRHEYLETARSLGRELVRRRIGLVYGGGNVGLMGVVADSVLEAGGEAIGVIPKGLLAREVAHAGLTDLRVVGSMHERKAMMADLSDGFLALPGGLGTFEELLEILTWAQLGVHAKPCAVVNTCGYFDPLLRLLDHAVAERFLKPVHLAMLLVADSPQRAIDAMGDYRAVAVEKWIDRSET